MGVLNQQSIYPDDLRVMTEIIGLSAIVVFPLCMMLAFFYDLFTMTIPNRLVFFLAGSFLVLAPLAGMSLETMGLQIGVMLIALVIGFTLFSFGWIGGGDAKLIAATVLWFSPALGFSYILIAGLLGGALTILLVLARQLPLPAGLMKVQWIDRLHDGRQGVPYGMALGPAALIVFPDSRWMTFFATGATLG